MHTQSTLLYNITGDDIKSKKTHSKNSSHSRCIDRVHCIRAYIHNIIIHILYCFTVAIKSLWVCVWRVWGVRSTAAGWGDITRALTVYVRWRRRRRRAGEIGPTRIYYSVSVAVAARVVLLAIKLAATRRFRHTVWGQRGRGAAAFVYAF